VASSWSRIWFFALALLLSFASSSPAQNVTGQSAETYLPFLTITPSGPVIVKASSSLQFVANGAGSRKGGVKWELEGNNCAKNDCGTISADGLYKAPETVLETFNITVVARSPVSSLAGTAEELVVVPGTFKTRRAPCASAQPGYCNLAWQIHQLVSPYSW
jgi:hypothetical protein